MTRQRLARLFLAATLVLAQYGVFAHALSHLDKARYGNDGGVPVGHAAEVCISFAAAASGAVASSGLPPHTHVAPRGFATSTPADPLLPALALTRFASRAPPLPT